MAVKSFLTNDLVAEMDMYKEFDELRRKEMKVDGPHEKLFYKSGLIGDPKEWKAGWYQKKKKALCKCACMTIAYNIWYKYVSDRAIDEGATSYKKFVDVPKTVLSTMKRIFETEIKAKCCDVNSRIGKRGDFHYDFCRYLAMYWTYLDCAKDTTTQRFFPTQMTITRAAEVFGYEAGENPFKMNGKYFNYTETGREIVKVSENQTPFDPKIVEVIDEYMEDEPKDDRPIEDIPVEEFDFTCRTYNCLQRKDIRTLGDILKTPLHDLICIRNFGRRSLEEVQEVLKKYGYQYIVGDPDHCNDVPALICKAKVADVWDSLTGDEKDSVAKQIVSADDVVLPDNFKAPNEIAKKMYDLETENEEIRNKYEKLNSMYLKCASALEDLEKLKKENEELEQMNKILSNGKLEDMQAYERLKNRFDDLRAEYNRSLSQPTRNNVTTMIKEVIDAMHRDKIEEIGVIVDGFVVQIHPRKDEKKLGTYTIRTRESIV